MQLVLRNFNKYSIFHMCLLTFDVWLNTVFDIAPRGTYHYSEFGFRNSQSQVWQNHVQRAWKMEFQSKITFENFTLGEKNCPYFRNKLDSHQLQHFKWVTKAHSNIIIWTIKILPKHHWNSINHVKSSKLYTMNKYCKLLTINYFCKTLHLDVWHGSKYISAKYEEKSRKVELQCLFRFL